MDKRFKEVKFYEIEYDDFDKIATEVLGKAYECVAENEWNNYSSYDFQIDDEDIDENSMFMKYDLEDIQEWQRGEKKTVSAVDVLTYMLYKGLIVPGKYLIKVFW